jgi:hypothetical protein
MSRRLTIFAKGNIDVQASLHSHRVGGELAWNGINELIRPSAPSLSVRVRHETFTRSDALLAATGTVPPDLAARVLPFGSFPVPSQFGRAVFDGRYDAVVLSVQPDVHVQLHRNRTHGYLLFAAERQTWPAADRDWLKREFTVTPLLDVAESMRALAAVVAVIRAVAAEVPILIYNVSALDPADSVHCHLGFEETLAERARRFNLGLIDLSRRTGISIVDVDAVVARAGAARLKLDALHLTAEGHRLVAAEVVRILADLGCLPEALAA